MIFGQKVRGSVLRFYKFENMKKLIKRSLDTFFRSILGNPTIWRFYRPMAELNTELYSHKLDEERELNNAAFIEKYKHLLVKGVRRGPFKGLQYPFFSAVYSAFFPKLLGYYEYELQEVLEGLKGRNYSYILDIGCAEGYYAVGLSKLFSGSTIVAYDLDPIARTKTGELAHANNKAIDEQFQIKEECRAENLLALDPYTKNLVFSDCEGFEFELFTDQVIHHLHRSDFIIEMHDFVSPGSGDSLISRFDKTHQVSVVQSIPDLFRYRFVEDPQINSIPLDDRLRLLSEKRPTQMEWLVCLSKNQ